jgi:drug/metabolite transporter (DMT)-like permease
MAASSSSRSDVLRLALAAAAWGFGTAISKRAFDELPPLALLPVQLAASLVVLVVAMRLRGVPLRSGAPIALSRLGILNPGLAYALGLLGLAHITASASVLLWAVEPLLILGLAAVVLHERVTPRLVLLSGAAIAGLALVVGGPGIGDGLVGVGLTLAGVGCCATYTVVSRRWLDSDDSTLPVVLGQQAHALAFAGVLGVGAWLAGDLPLGPVSRPALLSAVASGVLYYAAAYWLYLSALRRVAASLAAFSFYLIPLFGLAASFLMLGEHLTIVQWTGAAVVLAALVAVTRSVAGPVRPEATARAVALASPRMAPASLGSGHPVRTPANEPGLSPRSDPAGAQNRS